MEIYHSVNKNLKQVDLRAATVELVMDIVEGHLKGHMRLFTSVKRRDIIIGTSVQMEMVLVGVHPIGKQESFQNG